MNTTHVHFAKARKQQQSLCSNRRHEKAAFWRCCNGLKPICALSLLLLAGAGHAQTTGKWNINANGNWTDTTRWLDGVVPNGVGDTANIVFNITSTRTITLDVPVTLGILRIGDTNATTAFTLTGQTLTFDNGGAGAILDHGVGSVTGGPAQNPHNNDRLNMEVILNDNLTIHADKNISFYGAWDAQGNDLTINAGARVYFAGTNGTTNNGRISNAGTITINSGELRFDGQAGGVASYVDAQTIELGNGLPGTENPFARLFLVNTEATQDFDLNMNGYSWFINDLGNNNQTFTGNIHVTGAANSNLIDVNDAGTPEQHFFTGVISGTGGFSKINAGAMVLSNDNTFEGELFIQRGRTANMGSVHLTGAAGALSNVADMFISRDGSLYLDNSADVNNNRINDTANLVLRGMGRMRIIGNGTSAVSETLGDYLVDTGAGRVNFDLDDATPQSVTLTFASFNREAGAVAQFQVLDAIQGSLGTIAQLHFTDAGASAVQFGGGGANGTPNMSLVVGAYGGSNDVSNHFMTFDSTAPTLMRPLDFQTEYLLSQNLIDNGVAHTLNRRTVTSVDQNLMINYNTTRAVDPDSQVNWYADAPIRVTENIAVNSLRFGTNTPTVGSNTNERGSTLALDADVTLYLGDSSGFTNGIGVDTNGTGMILFGRDVDGTSPGSNQYITGGVLDFGSREALLVNESGNNALLRTEIRGTGGLTKAGAGTIYLDNSNSYSGTTTIAEGILDVRDQGALGFSTLVQTQGSGSLYLELGTALPDTIDMHIGTLDASRTVLRSNAGNNTFSGNIIVDTADGSGNFVFTPYINVATGDTLNLNGNIYGAVASNPLSPDINLNDSRMISTNSSSSGIININGIFQDNADGAVSAVVSAANENDLLRFQIGGHDQLVVNVRNQWNAAGRILLERGYLRFEGEGNFWSDDAAAAITATNGQSGMRISGSLSTAAGNINLVLTKDGQKLNIDRIDIGANGSSSNYNSLGNITLAGANSSGTVTFGNGTGILLYGSSDAARSHTRDLSVYAMGGGTVNMDFRLDEADVDVHTSFTKIGRGIVNLRGDNTTTSGDVEQVNLSGGLLRLTNYGSSTGTRFDNGAMVVFAGGGIEMDGVGSIANETENLLGTAVAGSITFPASAAATIISAGGTDVIVTSDADRTTTLNIGDTTIDLLRASGGTLHFVENTNGGTAAITFEGNGAPAADSAIAWATYGDSYNLDAAQATYTLNALDFAMTTGSGGSVTAFSGATRENTDDAATWTNGSDVSEGAAGFSGTTVAGANVNTLHFDHDGAGTLTLDAGGLVVESGGIMVSSLVGTAGSTKMIDGGQLTAGAGNDLIVHQYGADTMTIASVIADNGLTALVKTGSGELVLSGTNTYAGGTYLNGGTLTIAGEEQLGAASASVDASNLYFNGGALRTTADVTLDPNRGIVLGGNGGELNVDAGTTLTYAGLIDQEPNLTAGYTANPAVGRLDKTGAGTLLWTNVANNTFAGLLDIKEGTLSWAPEAVIANSTIVDVFGTNNAFLDGTIVRSGATLDISPASMSGVTSSIIINEWFTFEAGSTLNTAQDSDDNRAILLRGVLHFDSMGLTGAAGSVIVDSNRNSLTFNDDGGYLTGDGGIIKIGAGNLYLREHSPEWTGQMIIAEGNVAIYSAGTPLGVGAAPILLGHDGFATDEPASGNTIASLQFRDEGGYRDVTSVAQDIIVRNENGLGNQTKRLGAAYLAHADVVNFNGTLTLNDDVEFFYQDDARDSAGTSAANIRNDTRAIGAPTNSETVFINFNGDIFGTTSISTNVVQSGTNNAINGSLTGAMDDLVINPIFGLNGDNRGWTGILTISNNNGSGTAPDDVDRTATVRLGNEFALNDNLVRFGTQGYLQVGGIDKTFTQDFLFIGAPGLGTTAKIQNAAENDVTLTFHADAGKVGTVYQDIGVGMEDGIVFAGSPENSGVLNVLKTGAGNTVFGASTGGGDIADSFSRYTGTTIVQEGILYAGSNNALSPYSRFIVNDGAELSLFWDQALTGFDNTIGSLSGTGGALVDIDNSALRMGGDNTAGADFSGVISGLGDLYKIGTGSQRLSGGNTFIAGNVAIVEGTLIGGSNTAFGDEFNEIQLGGVPLVTENPIDGRVELLLDGSANAVANAVLMNLSDGNDEGITVIGTRATAGTFGFAETGTFDIGRSIFVRADGTSTFQFRGEINDFGDGVAITKTCTGTVEFHTENLYGPVGSAGLAIDGGTFIRSGTLSILDSGALAETVVELGDTRHELNSVYLATTSSLITEVAGRWEETGDGAGGAGPGALVNVKAEVDGVALTTADVGKRILVKDEGDSPERNGIYEIVSVNWGRNEMNLVRVDDFDESSEMLYGSSVAVTAGTQAGSSFFLASQDIAAVNAEETDPLHWEQELANANLGLIAGIDGLTIINDIDINDTNGTGASVIGGAFTSGNSIFAGNITLQHQDGVDNIREVTLTSASDTVAMDGERGAIFTGILSEAQLGDTLHVRIGGGGSVTLTGDAHTYTGKTTVGTDSTLVLHGAGSIASSNWLEVESGAAFDTSNVAGGTYTLAGTVSGVGTLQPGAGNILVIDGAGAIKPGLSSEPYLVAAAGDQIGAITVNGNLDLAGDAVGVDRLILQMGATNGADYNDSANFSANGGAGFNAWLVTQGDTYDTYKEGNHDRLTITGDLSLDAGGHIIFDNDGGNAYNPEYGDVFNLLDWTTLSQNDFDDGGVTRDGGQWGDLSLPSLSGSLFYNTSLWASHGIVVVVPEPSRAVLMLAGFMAILLRRRRRTESL